MMSFITLAICGLFLAYAIVHPRRSFLGYIFLLPFMPRYIGLAVGDSGGALSLNRMLSLILTGILLLIAFKYPRKIKKVFRDLFSNKIFVLITLLFATKFIATFYSSPLNLIYWFDEVMACYSVIILGSIFVKGIADVYKILFMLCAGLLFAEFLAILEYSLETPVLTIFAASDIASTREVGEAYIRDSKYRVMGPFTNPLLLAEYICIVFPFLLYFRKKYKKLSLRILFNLAIILAIPILLLTGSRAGLLIIVISATLFLILNKLGRMGKFGRIGILTIMVTFTTVSLIGVVQVYQNQEIVMSDSQSSNNSIISRMKQFGYALEILQTHPLLGVGMTSNLISDVDEISGLDNYWLRIFFESGLLGFFIYIFLAISFFRFGIKVLFKFQDKDAKLFVTCWLTVAFAFFMWKFFVSIPKNNVYIFILFIVLFYFEKYRELGKGISFKQ